MPEIDEVAFEPPRSRRPGIVGRALLEAEAQLVLENSTLGRNSARSHGGAVSLAYEATASIVQTNFLDNSTEEELDELFAGPERREMRPGCCQGQGPGNGPA